VAKFSGAEVSPPVSAEVSPRRLLEYLAMTRRKAASVTSAIGAIAKKGLGNLSQKFLESDFSVID